MKQFVIDTNSLNSVIDFIIKIYHAPLRNTLCWLETEILQFEHEYSEDIPVIKELSFVFVKFKTDIFAHMSSEEHTLFPILQAIEDCADGIICGESSAYNVYEFKNVIARIEEEHSHIDTVLPHMLTLLKNSGVHIMNVYLYEHFYNYFTALNAETLRHANIENTILHPLAREKFALIEKRKES